MAYDKTQPIASGKKLVELLYALSDGLDIGDTDEMVSFITSLTQSVDELTGDTDAAIAHLLSGAAEEFGDRRVNPPTP